MIRKCLTCNKEFDAPKGSVKKGYGKYCSSKCAALGRWKEPTEKMKEALLETQKIAWKSRIGSTHSNKTKLTISKSRKGKCLREDNPKWSGGIQTYRKMVALDKCSLCGSNNNLIVHHQDKNRRNNSLENLVVLCTKCHCKVHNHYNRWEDKNARWLINNFFLI